MNVNKWLCEQFDAKKKGYVTIGDIAYFLIAGIILVLAIIFIMAILYIGTTTMLTCGISNECVGGEQPTLRAMATAFTLFMGTATAAGVIYIVGRYIFSIRVAKCPLKEDDTK